MLCPKCAGSGNRYIGKYGLVVDCIECMGTGQKLVTEEKEKIKSEDQMSKKVSEMTPEQREHKREYSRNWARKNAAKRQGKIKSNPTHYPVDGAALHTPQKSIPEQAIIKQPYSQDKMTAIIVVLRGTTEDVLNTLDTLLLSERR